VTNLVFCDRDFQIKQARVDAPLYAVSVMVCGGFATGFWQSSAFSYIRGLPALLAGLLVGYVFYRAHLRTALVVDGDEIRVCGLFRNRVLGRSEVCAFSCKAVMHGADCLALVVKSPRGGTRSVAVRSWPEERADDEQLRLALPGVARF
jgi:hypothetical protein